MKKFTMFLEIVFLLSIFPFFANAQDSPLSPYDEKLVQNYLAKFGTKSLVIGVIKDGVQSVKGYGKINRFGKKKVTPDGNTMFEIGSITKVFTTLILADLVKKDSIQLNEPIINLLPKKKYSYSKSINDITILNLATHTSGLPRVTNRSINGILWSRIFPPLAISTLIFGYFNPYRNYDTTKLFRDLRHIRLDNKVGSKSSYSNFGMTTLGYILTNKSKLNYDDLLTKTVLDTLRMNKTFLDLPESEYDNIADGHNKFGMKTPKWTFKDKMQSTGAINSTVHDLMKFLEVNLEGQKNLYLHNLFDDCQTTRYKISEQRSIGLAWIKTKSENTNNQEIIWHNGGTGGFRSFLGFNKETKTGIVILSNSVKSVDKLAIDILKMLMKDEGNTLLTEPISGK
ncbi:MAG: serine hydrolase domain-containing protein [Arcicella sp.]|nr:serine hydrolase domain-containing protein [Arcicella sp.]